MQCVWHRVVERGRMKCGQYWPSDDSDIEQYGSFAVINSGVEVAEHHCITSLLLQNLEVCYFCFRLFLYSGKLLVQTWLNVQK